MYQLNLESRDSNGMTPLQRSTAANARGEISAYFDKRLEQLMKLGANQNSLTADGRPLGILLQQIVHFLIIFMSIRFTQSCPCICLQRLLF